jgi:hypothetical protein
MTTPTPSSEPKMPVYIGRWWRRVTKAVMLPRTY